MLEDVIVLSATTRKIYLDIFTSVTVTDTPGDMVTITSLSLTNSGDLFMDDPTAT